MNDTNPEVGKLYSEMLLARPGRERFMMGFEMFEMAKSMMRAGLEDQGRNASCEELFRRLYSDQFVKEELDRIVRRINATQG
jgi:hypothetical protein